jgi:hypothetical protein
MTCSSAAISPTGSSKVSRTCAGSVFTREPSTGVLLTSTACALADGAAMAPAAIPGMAPIGPAVPAVPLPAGTVAGVVRADIATAIQTMAAIIAAWYQLAPCPPVGPPGGSPTLAAPVRAPKRACPANHPPPAVNTVTCAIAGMPRPRTTTCRS